MGALPATSLTGPSLHQPFAAPPKQHAGHMAFSFAVLAPVAMQESLRSHKRTLERCWKGVLSIGACMALNIALNNISLLDVSLTLNQIIRWARRGTDWHDA